MLAIDWGSSSVRAWRLDEAGGVVAEHRMSVPLARTSRAELADVLAWLRTKLEVDGPVLACGMVGSAQGLVEAPYVTCPADLERLADSLVEADGLFVVPGLTGDGPAGEPDVMRGEETQLLGVLPASGSSLVVLPGTHSKWVEAQGRVVRRFATSLTGELRALLLDGSLVGSVAFGGADDAEAFEEGLALARREGGLLHHIFAARARVLRGRMPEQATASWLSGVLVGHEVVAMERCFGTEGPVSVVAEPIIAERWATAIGPRAVTIDGEGAALRGLVRIARVRGWLRGSSAPRMRSGGAA